MPLYSLCKRLRGNKGGRWQRVSDAEAYPKPMAIRIFQSELLANAFGELDGDWEYRLRIVSLPERSTQASHATI